MWYAGDEGRVAAPARHQEVHATIPHNAGRGVLGSRCIHTTCCEGCCSGQSSAKKQGKITRGKWRNQASCYLRSFFLDTAENAPLMLQEIIFILSRLNFFLPSFSQKKNQEEKEMAREGKQNTSCFLGEPQSYLTISGQPQEKHIPGWECFAGGVIIDWNPKKLAWHPVFRSRAKIPALTWSWASQLPRQVVLLSTTSSSVTRSLLHYCELGWTHHHLEQ